MAQHVAIDLDARSTHPHLDLLLGEARQQASARARAAGTYARYGKPAFDVAVAVVLLLVILPVLLAVALAIRVQLGPGVFFLQERVGQGGRPFRIIKFRTMRHASAEELAAKAADPLRDHKSAADPRHTPLGRFLRKWSLDELPQLINVVRGEMSLVGPRPEMVEIVDLYEPWQHGRHAVRPGITGLWQVSGRGDIAMHQGTEIDLQYVESLSLASDLAILLRTPLAAVKGH